jgi:hypothetical protein
VPNAVVLDGQLSTLRSTGFVHLSDPSPTAQEAFARAARVLAPVSEEGIAPLAVLGDFVLPPRDGPPSRDFQLLHFDFGIPLDPVAPADVGQYTALHVSARVSSSTAVTRLVPLAALLGQQAWPPVPELLRRFRAYGHSHGARRGTTGYTEGSLARIIEAASGRQPTLPSVKTEPGFLCGNELASTDSEREFLAERGACVMEVEMEVHLQPGELLIFDNLRLAHGRHGVRSPGELHQRVYGYRALPASGQRSLRSRVLAAFER